MKAHLLLTLACLGCLGLGNGRAGAADLLPDDPAHLSLRHEVAHAISKGLSFLNTQQKPEGWWSTADDPAVTGLVVTAALRQPGFDTPSPAVVRGLQYIVSCAKPDGSITREELANYNTSICLMALLASGQPKHAPLITRARQFLIGEQDDFGEKGKRDNPFDGGVGYGDDGPQSDLSNTVMALEAIRASRAFAPAQEQAKELNWQAAIEFVQACQNLPEYNKEPWVSGDPQNKGGFIYTPGKSEAGELKLPDGSTALRSYGSMTYAGLLSYIYAEVKQDDPRVQAALSWLRANYTLDENPGLGHAGLFYYYHTMSKALAAAGQRELERPDGTKVDWRTDLGKRLVTIQAADGSWVNDNGRWWEKDPVLVTAYTVLALETIYRAL